MAQKIKTKINTVRRSASFNALMAMLTLPKTTTEE